MFFSSIRLRNQTLLIKTQQNQPKGRIFHKRDNRLQVTAARLSLGFPSACSSPVSATAHQHFISVQNTSAAALGGIFNFRLAWVFLYVQSKRERQVSPEGTLSTQMTRLQQTSEQDCGHHTYRDAQRLYKATTVLLPQEISLKKKPNHKQTEPHAHQT